MKNILTLTLITLSLTAFSISWSADQVKIPELEEGRRGCCSWHGGVCGCSSGRAKCCDGSLSPSYGCKHDSSTDYDLSSCEKIDTNQQEEKVKTNGEI